jgi:hypothetical protein
LIFNLGVERGIVFISVLHQPCEQRKAEELPPALMKVLSFRTFVSYALAEQISMGLVSSLCVAPQLLHFSHLSHGLALTGASEGRSNRYGELLLLMGLQPLLCDGVLLLLPGSEAASVRQTIFNCNFPETLFSFGISASGVFPSDPKVMATRILMAFTNVQLLSYADR